MLRFTFLVLLQVVWDAGQCAAAADTWVRRGASASEYMFSWENDMRTFFLTSCFFLCVGNY